MLEISIRLTWEPVFRARNLKRVVFHRTKCQTETRERERERERKRERERERERES